MIKLKSLINEVSTDRDSYSSIDIGNNFVEVFKNKDRTYTVKVNEDTEQSYSAESLKDLKQMMQQGVGDSAHVDKILKHAYQKIIFPK
jgi:hypothetical protein